jgi:hypothetical protein
VLYFPVPCTTLHYTLPCTTFVILCTTSHFFTSLVLTLYTTLHHLTSLPRTQMLHEAAYGEDSPLGSSMYNSNLNKLTAEDIMIFRQQNYNANNITGKRILVIGIGIGIGIGILKRLTTSVLVPIPVLVFVIVLAVARYNFTTYLPLFLLCDRSYLQRMVIYIFALYLLN